MIDRHDPFGRAMGLRQVMDRLLEDAFVMPRGAEGQAMAGPALNVYEEGDQLTVEAQLPGMKSEDLDINVEQGVFFNSDNSQKSIRSNFTVNPTDKLDFTVNVNWQP